MNSGRSDIPKIRQHAGSVTVEASVAMPFFVIFVMLFVFLIKAAWVSLDLNYAVNETARQIASVCYPISFINEAEDAAASEMNLVIGSNTPDEGVSTDSSTGWTERLSLGFIQRLAEGSTTGFDSGDILKEVISVISGVISEKTIYSAIERFAGMYYRLRTEAEYAATDSIFRSYLAGTSVPGTSTTILYARFPQSNYRYAMEKAGSSPGGGIGIPHAEALISADDVVVSALCTLKIPLPFIGGRELHIRHTAVEKACLKGYDRGQESFLIPFSKTDGDPGNKEAENINIIGQGDYGSAIDELHQDLIAVTVYITRTGTRYHRCGCRYLARSCIPVKETEAVGKGYVSCRVCDP